MLSLQILANIMYRLKAIKLCKVVWTLSGLLSIEVASSVKTVSFYRTSKEVSVFFSVFLEYLYSNSYPQFSKNRE